MEPDSLMEEPILTVLLLLSLLASVLSYSPSLIWCSLKTLSERNSLRGTQRKRTAKGMPATAKTRQMRFCVRSSGTIWTKGAAKKRSEYWTRSVNAWMIQKTELLKSPLKGLSDLSSSFLQLTELKTCMRTKVWKKMLSLRTCAG